MAAGGMEIERQHAAAFRGLRRIFAFKIHSTLMALKVCPLPRRPFLHTTS
jgi:hypothetical protein